MIIDMIRDNSIHRVKYFMDVLSDKGVFDVLEQVSAQENLFENDQDYYPSSPRYDDTDVVFDIEDVSEYGSPRGGSPISSRGSSPRYGSPISSRGGSPYSIPPSPTYSVPSSPNLYSRFTPPY